ncbi:MAG: hypothetical protein JNM18_10635, partial [Planctomycetaceae bacterium]|nr:hypothetical protein [Planctomycetaceae bacterium]
NADGALYFAATDANGDREIWRSGGGTNNTLLDTNVNPTGNSDPTYLAYMNGYVYFSANVGATGRELYRVPAILPNFAPVLNTSGNPALPTIAEDAVANNGVSIATFVASVPYVMITDSDLGALQGIAITSVDTSRGTWEFSTNGGAAWQTMPAVSDSVALLLAANITTNRIRFVPNQDFYGTVTNAITFRAWDQFKGTNGLTLDASNNGGSRPFSRDSETASITVTPVGDRPVLLGAPPTTTEDVLTTPFVIAPSGVDGAPISTVQVFRVTGMPPTASLFTSANRQVLNNDEITVAEAAAGLRFQPPSHQFNTYTINFEAATEFTSSPLTFGGVGPALSVAIVVDATADNPSVSSASTLEDTITVSGLVVSRNAVDGPEVGFFKITNIFGGTLYKNDGVTVIPNGGFITAAEAGGTGLRFRPDPNFNGSATFDIQGATASSDRGLSGSVTVTIPVTAVNDAPINTLTPPQIVRQSTFAIPASFAFTGGAALSVFDVDSASGSITVQLDVSTGALTATGFDVRNSPSNQIEIRGDLTQVNSALSTLTYTPNQDYLGPVVLTMYTTDQGNTGLSGPLDDTDVVTLTVLADNKAPTITVPGAQTFNEDTTRPFSSGTNTQITVTDADSGTRPITVTLTSTLGVMTISQLGGATATGSGTATVTVQGSQTAVNTTLNSLVFIPTLNANGIGSIQISANDRGNYGFGGPLITNSNIVLNISPVNDPPVNSAPLAALTLEDQSLSFTSSFGNLISTDDVDVGAGNVTVTLSVGHGILNVNPVGGVTIPVNFAPTVSITGPLANVNAALAFVNYRPDTAYTGGDSLTITTSDLGNSGSGGTRTDVDTVAITIQNRNRAPIHTLPGTQTLNEDTPLTFSAGGGNALSITDVDSGLFPITTTLTVVNGKVVLGNTAGLTIGGNGNDSNLITMLGTVADIAAALDNLVFAPTPDFSGVAMITIASNDLGNSGFGGAQLDTDTLIINVAAVNDPPVNSVPNDQDAGLNTPFVFSDAASNRISVSDVDVGFTNMQVDLAVTNGTLTLGSTTGVGVTGNGTSNVTIQGNIASINFVLDNLRFTPSIGFLGDADFTMTSYDAVTGSPLSDTDSFVIRVRDSIEISGNTMYVTGSNIDDIMSLVFTSNTAYTVNINGRQLSADTSSVHLIRFNGGLGNDRLTINDSGLAASAVFSPLSVTLTASGYVVDGDTTETITINGSAADNATFNDSAGDDTFTATRSYAIMVGTGYTNQVLGFGRETANASTGNDTAQLFDSAGNDRFTAYPTVSFFTGSGIDYTTNGFDRVFANASTGVDVATFVDSPGNDTYTTRPAYATFEGPGFSQRADGFDQTYAFVAAANVSGTDRAIYYDSTGTDIYYALQYYSLIYGTGYFHEAVGFDSSVAYSTAGGFDYAVLFDSTANDTATGSYVQLMIVSPLGMSYSAVGFDQATAISSFGGTDKAVFYDSAGNDRYYGLITHSGMVGPGYFVQAYGYSDARAVGGAGGQDIAILYGSTGNDTLTGAGSSAQVKYQNNRITGVSGFRTVQAIAGKGGVDRRSIAAIDYLMQVYGTWPPG